MSSFRPLLALLALGLAAAPARAEWSSRAAAGASEWSRGLHATMRLLDGGPQDAAGRVYAAGIEIKLDPQFKTYWRTPGDSGLPPEFDWSASQNVAGVTVLWPAPYRFEDAAGSSIGYKEHVVLPLSVEAADPAKPVVLALKLDYAVCEQICIPVKGEAKLALAKAGLSTPHMAAIAEARKRAPAQHAIGDGPPPTFRSVEASGGKALLVSALVPDTAGVVDIFAEGPDGWVFSAPVPVAALPHGPGARLVNYRIPATESPKDGDVSRIPVVLTLTADDAAVETKLTPPALKAKAK
ncbi:hypothetical protein NK718_11940 [Alsobacter sp. SYSU M60028]|uniref:Thiol:disulfide interchange protein DsbD N-terminal domain-containing protein n=1 Tax=Alsobacter ponti TaxID=2962936 RepID=A0ABT1LER3_9HYPH|nr:protein-disulfide reductase DsbD domain-containing protein [Alsobacter ponti]MCP8939230.1 hypothetical protein [Alsobacter ponti]